MITAGTSLRIRAMIGAVLIEIIAKKNIRKNLYLFKKNLKSNINDYNKINF